MRQEEQSPKSHFVEIGEEIGKLVAEKNLSYGSSFSKCGDFLRLLYPNGIQPEQYTDLLLLARIFDKCCRLATRKDAFGESPYRDMCGYSILGVALDEDMKRYAAYLSNGKSKDEEQHEETKRFMPGHHYYCPGDPCYCGATKEVEP
jgi:hypothetical protein